MFRMKAKIKVTPSVCRTPPNQNSGYLQAYHEGSVAFAFDVNSEDFDTSSMVHLHSSP
jgi:hypothetical protein